MAILVSDPPLPPKQDHLSPQQDTLQECGAHGDSGYTYNAVRAVSEAATRELRYRGGEWGCAWWVESGEWGTAYTTCTQKGKDRGREKEREADRQAASIPFYPASAPTICPARTQRCSWARRGTSWCLPFYPGAPTRSCGEAGVREGWGVGWKRANPYQVVSMATSIG